MGVSLIMAAACRRRLSVTAAIIGHGGDYRPRRRLSVTAANSPGQPPSACLPSGLSAPPLPPAGCLPACRLGSSPPAPEPAGGPPGSRRQPGLPSRPVAGPPGGLADSDRQAAARPAAWPGSGRRRNSPAEPRAGPPAGPVRMPRASGRAAGLNNEGPSGPLCYGPEQLWL